MKSNDLKKKGSPFVGLASFVIITAGVMYAESIITPLLMALFISIISFQPISWLRKKKVSQGFAITIVLVGIVLVFFGLGEIIGSSVSSFSEDAPKYEKNLDEMGRSVGQYLELKGIDVSDNNLSTILAPSKIMQFTTGILKQLGGFMGNTLTILFLVLFLLMELESFSIKSKAIVKSTNVSVDYLETIAQSIRHYLSIKTMTSLLTGAVIWIGLLIIGIDYAIIWALIAFLLNYIPNIGSIIAAVPAVMFSLIQLGFGGALWTMMVFVVVNVVVGNFVEPKMMGKGLGLSTFVIFVSLIFWGFVLGTVGMFLSVPLTMAIKIILDQNESTKWVAVILGSDEDAKLMLAEDSN